MENENEKPVEIEKKTVDIVGVRFKTAGKVYTFSAAGIELEKGDMVIVDTARGMEMGQVTSKLGQAFENDTSSNLKSVMRKATDEDIENAKKISLKENEALGECENLVARIKLPMKLISAEYNFDGSRLTIFFGSEGRVDFRELVRELSRKLRVRVEMRQVGPRDEAKMIGGFGRCGRPLCCAGFLSEFRPVSIKMAKEQDLPLNPMKISGVCGRLLCCLSFECEQYKEMKKGMPKRGEFVPTDSGMAKVIGRNLLKGVAIVELEGGARMEVLASEIMKNRKEPPQDKDIPRK